MAISLAMLSPAIDRLSSTAAPGAASPASVAKAGSDFADTLASLAADAVSTIKNGETTAVAGMKGNASLQQVVEAVMTAEQTLQTVVAVRDKVVGAYLEISRMQI